MTNKAEQKQAPKTLWNTRFNSWVGEQMKTGKKLTSIANMIKLPGKDMPLSVSALSNILAGRRGVSHELAETIEKVTAGNVPFNFLFRKEGEGSEDLYSRQSIQTTNYDNVETKSGFLPEHMRKALLRGRRDDKENEKNNSTGM